MLAERTLNLPQSFDAPRPRPENHASRKPDTVSLLGLDVAKATRAEIAYWIAARAQGQLPTRISFLNAHCGNLARGDWRYRAALESATIILPDGAGVSIAAKAYGVSLGDNLNGTDLFAPLCRCLAFRRLPVYFLGGAPGVAEKAAQNAARTYPGLKVAGARDGFFAPQDEASVIDEINRSGARVLFVAFGVPDQDVWIARVQKHLHASVVLGVGGLLDFVSGNTPRAPLWMRRAGLEWIYRLKCEPGRMWKRYLVGNATFVANVLAGAARMRSRNAMKTVDLALKRIMDVLGAGAGLLALSPLLALTAIAIRMETPGPALFRQIRVGEDGKTFELLKFRSMRTGTLSETEMRKAANDRDDGVTFKLKRDPRVTAIGRFIRKYSIDELPQLWNVVRGDMSLVGPRPALPHEVAKYSEAERARLSGKPGLTCTWQIGGRADIPFPQQVALDVTYLRTRCIWSDIAILLRTPAAVLSGRGAY